MAAESRTPPRPQPALRVGVTGHRLNRLLKPDVDLPGLADRLRVALTEVRQAADAAVRECGAVYDGPLLLRLISPLAEGTDQIAADAALDLGYSLHVPLPCLAVTYKNGFAKPSERVAEDPWTSFDRLLGRAESVQVLDGSPDATLDGGAYAAVGRTVLRHADLLIAVWDCAPAEGAGGTAAVVDQARLWNVPVLLIDPRHPEGWRLDYGSGSAKLAAVIRDVIAPPPEELKKKKGMQRSPSDGSRLHDSDSADLRGITAPLLLYLGTQPKWGVGGLFSALVQVFTLRWPPMGRLYTLGRSCIVRARAGWDALWTSPAPVDPAIAKPITQLLREYYAWADGLAERFGTLHRDLATAPYILAPIAVLATLFAQHRLADAGAGPRLRAMAAFAILLLNFLLYLRAVSARYHDRWIDYRSLAEQLRHLAFLWPLGRPIRAVHFGGEAAGEAPRYAWVGWYGRAVARQAGLFPVVLTSERLAELRQLLIDRFIRPQLAYHARTTWRFHRVQTVLHRVALGLFAAAMLLAGTDFVVVLGGHAPLSVTGINSRLGWAALFGMLAILLPAVGTGVHGFLSQGDFGNLSRRSDQMCRQLISVLESASTTALTLDALGDLAEEAADAMREEVLNWRVFARLKAPALV